jgi:hypothetical protein
MEERGNSIIFMDQKEKEIRSRFKFEINICLPTISFTLFGIIVSLNPSLLKESFLLPMRLTITIPLLLSSIFARSKLAYTQRPKLWESYGFITFLISYSFLINILGILLAASVGLFFGLAFLFANIMISMVYSSLEVLEDKSKLFLRIKKDLFFIILLILGGILPAIGLY